MPLDTMLLQLVGMGIKSLLSFPFPTPPPRDGLVTAIRALVHLGALATTSSTVPAFLRPLDELPAGEGEAEEGGGGEAAHPPGYDDTSTDTAEYELTALGTALAEIPVAPALGKMLVVGRQRKLLPHVLACVAGMTVQDPFIRPRLQVSSKAPKAAATGSGEGGDTAPSLGDGSDWEEDDVTLNVTWSSSEDEDDGDEGEDSDAELLDPELAARRAAAADAVAQRKAQWVERQRQRQKEAVASAKAAHATWRHPQSDVLTIMRVAGAYAHAATEEVRRRAAVVVTEGPPPAYLWVDAPQHKMRDADGAAFCRAQWVRGKGMLEVFQLRRQLWQVLVRESLAPLPPFPKAVAKAVHGVALPAALTHLPRALGPPPPRGLRAAEAASSASLDASEAVEAADTEELAKEEEGEEAREGAGVLPAPPIPAHQGGRKTQPPGTLTTLRPLRSRMLTWQDTYTPRLKVPSPRRELLLRQVVAAGLITRVARRAPADRVGALLLASGVTHTLSTTAQARLKGSVVPYLPADRSLPSPLFVHPGSAVASETTSGMPGWVVFTDVITSSAAHGRTFMRGVTAVEAGWLPELAAGTPLVRYGPPLDSPLPLYDAAADCVMASVVPRFGDHSWTLPVTRIPHPDPAARLRVFGRALLEGAVLPFPAWRALTATLAAPASLITKGAPAKRVAALVGALAAAGVDCRARLMEVWSSQPGWLLPEIAQWLPKSATAGLQAVWRKVVAAALVWAEGPAQAKRRRHT